VPARHRRLRGSCYDIAQQLVKSGKDCDAVLKALEQCKYCSVCDKKVCDEEGPSQFERLFNSTNGVLVSCIQTFQPPQADPLEEDWCSHWLPSPEGLSYTLRTSVLRHDLLANLYATPDNFYATQQGYNVCVVFDPLPLLPYIPCAYQSDTANADPPKGGPWWNTTCDGAAAAFKTHSCKKDTVYSDADKCFNLVSSEKDWQAYLDVFVPEDPCQDGLTGSSWATSSKAETEIILSPTKSKSTESARFCKDFASAIVAVLCTETAAPGKGKTVQPAGPAAAALVKGRIEAFLRSQTGEEREVKVFRKKFPPQDWGDSQQAGACFMGCKQLPGFCGPGGPHFITSTAVRPFDFYFEEATSEALQSGGGAPKCTGTRVCALASRLRLLRRRSDSTPGPRRRGQKSRSNASPLHPRAVLFAGGKIEERVTRRGTVGAGAGLVAPPAPLAYSKTGAAPRRGRDGRGYWRHRSAPAEHLVLLHLQSLPRAALTRRLEREGGYRFEISFGPLPLVGARAQKELVDEVEHPLLLLGAESAAPRPRRPKNTRLLF
jgi:hypothetical protein